MTDEQIVWLRLRDHLAERHGRPERDDRYGEEPFGLRLWNRTLAELRRRHFKQHRGGTRRCGHWHPTSSLLWRN